jgi:3',5'-cyclic-AMP phosphodiesterase
MPKAKQRAPRLERKENTMKRGGKDELAYDHNHDGIDRRGFLKCMAWAGTGALCLMNGGVLRSASLSGISEEAAQSTAELSFVQISDSHMGFNKPANQDVVGTLKAAVEKINALPNLPEFLLHTGDISHLSKPEEFDTVEQILKSCVAKDVFYVPGEHDVINDEGAQYLERFGKGSTGTGWRSFDKKGVRFVGLVNVMNLKAGGLGSLGTEQLAWLEQELRGLSASTPIVAYAHIPLWNVYPEWGWGTEDSAQALGYLKRFGSVTVLNGHIHQTMQKVEGQVTFHTAASTAFPQPEPGKADGPGPMKVPAEELRKVLGITDVNFVRGQQALAIVDSKLA